MVLVEATVAVGLVGLEIDSQAPTLSRSTTIDDRPKTAVPHPSLSLDPLYELVSRSGEPEYRSGVLPGL